MNVNVECVVDLTSFAANKIKYFVDSDKKKSNFKLRVYIIGGGCSGFQYKFILDNNVSNDDYIVEAHGAELIVDPISLQYLYGGIVDYYEGLEGSKFVVINPNAKLTCSCGSSFNV